MKSIERDAAADRQAICQLVPDRPTVVADANRPRAAHRRRPRAIVHDAEFDGALEHALTEVGVFDRRDLVPVANQARLRANRPEKRDECRTGLIVDVIPVDGIRDGVETRAGHGSGDPAAEKERRLEPFEPQLRRDLAPSEPREAGRIRERRRGVVGRGNKRAAHADAPGAGREEVELQRQLRRVLRSDRGGDDRRECRRESNSNPRRSRFAINRMARCE